MSIAMHKKNKRFLTQTVKCPIYMMELLQKDIMMHNLSLFTNVVATDVNKCEHIERENIFYSRRIILWYIFTAMRLNEVKEERDPSANEYGNMLYTFLLRS